ncbi:dnaJ homolog subfamily C member 7 [Frankliniella occidentalis]|uniref:DnaJ homolog subfamily C member 7 n=1 Tax=Frankliniella occidentalis TaxID=133901 RepID=A0A6J1SD67_FRAOC|nr:dnaJ homolog subfamily C member 7 [Frankliniella occidentalis]
MEAPAAPIVIDLEPETDEVIDTTPEKTAEIKKENGNQLYKKKQYKKALPLYTEAILLSPNNASYYGNRAACYIMLNQYNDALADVRKSLEIDPKLVKGYLRMAKCCMMMGDLSAADKALLKVQEMEPNNPQLVPERINLGTLQKYTDDAEKCLEKKDFRKVVFLMDRVLEIVRGCQRFLLIKAESLALLGRHEEAQEIANGIIHADDKNVDAVYVRGLSLYYQDNVDKAFPHFRHILKLAPDHKKTQEIYKRARALVQTKESGNEAFKAGELQKAYDLYSQALLIDPLNTFTNAKLYFNRATVCSKMNKLQEAISDCSAALKLDEKYVKALLRRAKCHTDLNMLEEAVFDYEKAVQIERTRDNRRLLQEAKLALKRSKRKNYYKVLGIDKTASDEDIKKAYKKRALEHHPDRHSNASETEKVEQEKMFKEVGEAYAILSDPKERARYDSGQDLEEMEGMGSGWPGDFDGCGRFPGFFAGPSAGFNVGDGLGGYTFHFG